MENEKLLGVGVDISKAKFDVAFIFASGNEESFTLPNNKTGIDKLSSRILSHESQPVLVVESTGKYHLLLAIRLSEAEIDVRTINPLMTKRHMDSNIRKVKTDKADAMLLARMAIKEEHLPKRFVPNTAAIEVRHQVGLLASLEKKLQGIKAIIKNYTEMQQVLGFQIGDLEKAILTSVKDFEEKCELLEKKIQLTASKQEQLQPQTLQNLETIPGVGSMLASLLSMLDMTCTSSAQWIAYVGLDISVKQSGQWNAKGKITKRGHPYFRKRLYGGAWGAFMNDANFEKLYRDLRAKGRANREALNIIARKILRIAFEVATTSKPYDPKTAFGPTAI